MFTRNPRAAAKDFPRLRGNDHFSLLYARGVHTGNVRQPGGRMWEPDGLRSLLHATNMWKQDLRADPGLVRLVGDLWSALRRNCSLDDLVPRSRIPSSCSRANAGVQVSRIAGRLARAVLVDDTVAVVVDVIAADLRRTWMDRGIRIVAVIAPGHAISV
jgi:hypothetical protein